MREAEGQKDTEIQILRAIDRETDRDAETEGQTDVGTREKQGDQEG